MFQGRSGQVPVDQVAEAIFIASRHIRLLKKRTILTRRFVILRHHLLLFVPLEYCSSNRPWTGVLDMSYRSNWYREDFTYASDMSRSLNAPVPANAGMHRGSVFVVT